MQGTYQLEDNAPRGAARSHQAFSEKRRYPHEIHEPRGETPDSQGGPDILIDHKGGLGKLLIGVTCVDLGGVNVVNTAATQKLHAARERSARKHEKYDQMAEQIGATLMALVFESGGAFSKELDAFIIELGILAENREEETKRYYTRKWTANNYQSYARQLLATTHWCETVYGLFRAAKELRDKNPDPVDLRSALLLLG